MNDFSKCDVLVLGAGMAGLTAARVLTEAGRDVVVLEARARIGGRILSVHDPHSGLPIELGAEFVHGRPAKLRRLITEAGQSSYELDGKMYRFLNGEIGLAEENTAFELLQDLSEDEPDLSFAEWIAERNLPPEEARSAMMFVEGFNAADAQQIGTASLAKQQAAEDAIEGDRAYRLKNGYSTLPNFLRTQIENAGGTIELSTCVLDVHWEKGSVRVETSGAKGIRTFRARQCVVTVPLGVLKAGHIRFLPEPRETLDAAALMTMGNARRITYLFRDRFWNHKYPELSFLFAEKCLPSVWWTPAPETVPMLTGWIGGPGALHPAIAKDEDFAAVGMAALSKIFSMDEAALRILLKSWHTHDWRHDPFTQGAYSYAPKGALHASDTMAKPVEGTLFFAGEHTDTDGHWGTVHGALKSGMRVAGQVLATIG